jgi:transposase-like protein
MREFVFEIVYEQETAPLASLFTAGEKEVSSVGVGGCIDEDEFWRIERITGAQQAVSEIETDLSTELPGFESVTPVECEGAVHVEVLERSGEECEVYYHMEGVDGCESVATLTVEYLGTDVLLEVERDGESETWTVMMESDDGIGLLYDALQASLRPGLQFRFDHVGQASDRRVDLFARKNLSREKREALVKAVEQGYYETPRQITLDELAAKMDCPRSTLSYRLRRAESKLAKAFTFGNESQGLESLPRTPEESRHS